MLLKFLFNLASLVILIDGKLCDISPYFWCENPELAQLCNVSAQCANYSNIIYNKNVKLTLLYEAKCGGCNEFITRDLYPVIWQQLGSILNLELIPYGNAKQQLINGSWVFTCQHGPEECALNILHLCTIDYITDPGGQLLLIDCFERQTQTTDDPDVILIKCATAQKIPRSIQIQIQICVTSSKGKDLLHRAGMITENIWPQKHTHVPWILLNDVSSYQIQGLLHSLFEIICFSYKGENLPVSCKHLLMSHKVYHSKLMKKSNII